MEMTGMLGILDGRKEPLTSTQEWNPTGHVCAFCVSPRGALCPVGDVFNHVHRTVLEDTV